MMSDKVGVQVSTLSKDPDLIAVVMRLCDCWGDRAFDVVDHWEANFHGVGLAQKKDHAVLIYIDNLGKAEGTYYVELEGPPPSGSDQPFKSAGVYDTVAFEKLTSLVGHHLGLEHPKSEQNIG